MAALFVALGGTAAGQSAITAAKSLITGKGIKNGSVTGKDLKNRSVTGKDLKNGSVTGKDLKNGSVASGDVKNGSLLANDFKPGQLPAAVNTAAFVTRPQGDARYLRSNATAGGDLTGAYPAPTIAAGAVESQTVANHSLTLTDLGGSRPDETTTTVTTAIAIPAGQCQAVLTGNFGDGVVGDLVIGTLTNAAGNAVLPNTAAFVPSVVMKTTQGGAVPNLVVCSTDTGALTIPVGSVFHWRLIDA